MGIFFALFLGNNLSTLNKMLKDREEEKARLNEELEKDLTDKKKSSISAKINRIDSEIQAINNRIDEITKSKENA